MVDVLVVSDFNAELVSRYLAADERAPRLTAETAPYGQLFQTLSKAHPGCEQTSLFIWTRPEGISPPFRALIEGGVASQQDLLRAVDAFADVVLEAAPRFRTVLAASWVRSQAGRGFGLLDWAEGGQARALAGMNLRLAERFEGVANLRLLDAQAWLDMARPARDARYWHAMKSPFPEAVAQAAAREVKAAVRAFAGLSRKLIVLDLDDTLWGGSVGETGWEGVRLGGHDPVGEAFVDFQTALKALAARGVALGIVSKNTEAVALEAFDKHPEMVLRRADLAGWRITWEDKAESLADLVASLDLGLGAVVFIDDNPAERGRVAEAFPDVLVPDWPKDPLRFADALRQLDCFDQASLTAEDRARSRMYAEARGRGESLKSAASLTDWLSQLDIRVAVASPEGGDLTRAVQLANKTNQMNLRTRRFTEPEFRRWLGEGGARAARTIKVADRFGDLGLTGLVSWEVTGAGVEIADFVLSCRAMGRRIEALMAHLAVEAARAAGLARVVARLDPTARNAPCRDFWISSGFEQPEENLFVWDAAERYPKPDFIRLEAAPAASG
jgi:FkbH-like protein